MSVSIQSLAQPADRNSLLSWQHCLTDMDILSVKDIDLLMEASKEQQGQGELLLDQGQGQSESDEARMLMEVKAEPLHGAFSDDIRMDMNCFSYMQSDNMPNKTNKGLHRDSPLNVGELHGNGPGGLQDPSKTAHSHGDSYSNQGDHSPGDSNHNKKPKTDKIGYHGDPMDIGCIQGNSGLSDIMNLGISKPSQQQPGQQTQGHLYRNTSLEESLYPGVYNRRLYGREPGDEGPSSGHGAQALYGDQFSVSDPSHLHKGDAADLDQDADLILLGEEHPIRKCLVCSDEATGMYFGALVCVPCKTFFLRYAGDNFSFVCKHNRNCDITMTTRTQCKYCRYQKCLQVGMCRKERPAKVELTEGQQLCVVCQDIANGVHFGAITCEGCKKFFRRGLTENSSYVCKQTQQCEINPRTRNSCRYCRYQKCLAAGMSREAIQMGRPSKFKPVHHGTQGPGGDLSMPSYLMSPGRKDALVGQRSLSVDVGSGHPPHKMIKVEPPSPSGSMDSFGLSPLYPRLGSPGTPGLQQASPSGVSQLRRGTVGIMDLSSTSQGLGMSINPTMGFDSINTSFGSSSSGMLSPGLTFQQQQHFLETLSASLPDNVLQAVAQRAATTTLPPEESGHPVPTMSRPVACNASPVFSPLLTEPLPQEPAKHVSMGSSTSHSSISRTLPTSASQTLTSSHPGTLSGGVATFFDPPNYIQGKRYITNETLYNAFVQGALDDKVRLKEHKHKSRSQGASGSSTSSRVEMTSDIGGFLQPDLPAKNQLILNAQTLATSNAQAATRTPGLPSGPSTPAISTPSSPGQIEIPGMSDLDALGNLSSKSETVDYILFNQLMTPPTIDPLEGSRTEVPLLSSPQPSLPLTGTTSDTQQTASSGDPPSVPLESPSSMKTSTSDITGNLDVSGSVDQIDVADDCCMDNKQNILAPEPSTLSPSKTGTSVKTEATAGGTEHSCGTIVDSPAADQKSPSEMSNKSPASSTGSSSASSHFPDNGSVYEYVLELSKHTDLVKRKEDSDSEGRDKDSYAPTRDILSDDKAHITFKSFEDYWLRTAMPDENVMFTDKHNQSIFQIEKVYRHFVDTGTKVNRKIKKELENWMHIHEGQYAAPPSWINEKVVPIFTLMSVTYCRNLPGFIDFHKHDQSIIIKLGQSQSRILAAAKHWFDPVLGDFRDFMSWRGAKKGTSDTFKKELIAYAYEVQGVDMDDIEAALLNVLLLIAADYPELKNPRIIEKARCEVLDCFRAYTTAIYGTPNRRMESLFKLVPTLRHLGVKHHRMTFHMRSNRTSSTSSNP